MPYVVLIENAEDFDIATEQEMRRWWRHHCRKVVRAGEVFFTVGLPVRYNVVEGVKRLASFGIRARGAYR